MAKHTFASYLAFLFFSSALLLSLFPLTWSWMKFNTLPIIRFAWSDPGMGPAWWEKRWTWYGGPNSRYVGALIKGQRMLNARHPNQQYTLMPCVMLTGAVAMTIIAVGLFALLFLHGFSLTY